MATFNVTPANIDLIASLWGFEKVVAEGWLRCEGQTVANPTNPLNIQWLGRAPQTGRTTDGFATYKDAATGIRDGRSIMVRLASAGGDWYGYQAVLDAAGSHAPIEQARLIELSRWAEGHYGGDDTVDGCIRTYVRANVQEETMLRASPQRAIITAGTPAYESPDRARQLGTFTADIVVASLGLPLDRSVDWVDFGWRMCLVATTDLDTASAWEPGAASAFTKAGGMKWVYVRRVAAGATGGIAAFADMPDTWGPEILAVLRSGIVPDAEAARAEGYAAGRTDGQAIGDANGRATSDAASERWATEAWADRPFKPAE